jgi:acetate kinase
MGDRVLVVNTGSSSIKYQLFDTDGPRSLARGLVEHVGEDRGPADHEAAFADVAAALEAVGPLHEVRVVGHRVVHGGEAFVQPTVLDDAVIEQIERLAALAPLHNPANVTGIRAAMALLPGVPHVAVFDTAFHRTLGPDAFLYALPYELYTKHHIRRYGFHGTSHEYVGRRAAEHLGIDFAVANLVTLHLGNGASACAIRGGRSVDTSMGFGPLEGLVMGTRSGDVDATVVFHLVASGWSLDAVELLLNRSSGLKGLCGDNDMREVHRRIAEGDDRARQALDAFVHRLRKYVGGYVALLGRVDALVFTAGIGEHDPVVRARTCAGLDVLGIELDAARNEAAVAGVRAVHADGSRVAVLVVPTDEELAIAQQAYAVACSGVPSPVRSPAGGDG